MTQVFGTALDKFRTLQLACLDPSLNHGAVVLLSRLLWHLNGKTGQCNPSQETLAAALGTSTKTIRTHTRALEAAGYLRTKKGREVPPRTHYMPIVFRGEDPEYRKAEHLRLQRRKKSSGKHVKEHLKDRKAVENTEAKHAALASAPTLSKSDSIRRCLEQEMRKHYRSDKDAWEAMMMIPEERYQAEIDQIKAGQITVKAAAERLAHDPGSSDTP